jgi:hypothetical protein
LVAQAKRLSPGYSRAVKILHRIRRAIERVGSSSGPAISGGSTGATLGLGQIEAVEREEFPPEEFPADEQEESE